jgi:hypothetical protein
MTTWMVLMCDTREDSKYTNGELRDRMGSDGTRAHCSFVHDGAIKRDKGAVTRCWQQTKRVRGSNANIGERACEFSYLRFAPLVPDFALVMARRPVDASTAKH